MKYYALREQAIAVLHANRGNWAKIRKETNLDNQWLAKLSQGKIADPGVKKICALLNWADSQQNE